MQLKRIKQPIVVIVVIVMIVVVVVIVIGVVVVVVIVVIVVVVDTPTTSTRRCHSWTLTASTITSLVILSTRAFPRFTALNSPSLR
jgi:hypothetical protein